MASPPAITLPASAAQLSRPGRTCQVLQVFGNTCVSVCLSVPGVFCFVLFFFPQLFQPFLEAQRVLPFVFRTCKSAFCATFHPHSPHFSCCLRCRRRRCCCRKVRHNIELQSDQKPLQHNIPKQQHGDRAGSRQSKGGGIKLELKSGGGAQEEQQQRGMQGGRRRGQESLKPIQILALILRL